MGRVQTVIFDSNSPNNRSGTKDILEVALPEMSNVTGVQVNWSNIPFTWYVIDNTNNTFELEVANQDVPTNPGTRQTTTYSLSVRPGTYNPDSFSWEFIRLINTVRANGGATPVISPDKWRCILLPETTRLCFYCTDSLDNSGARVTFALRFSTGLAPILGFEPAVWYQSNTLHDGGSVRNYHYNAYGATVYGGEPVWNRGTVELNCAAIYAPYACKLLGPTNVEIVSELSNLPTTGSISRDAADPAGQLLLRVPLTVNYTSYQMYQNVTEVINLPSPKTIQYVRMYLRLAYRNSYTQFTCPQHGGFATTIVPATWLDLNLFTKTPRPYLPLNGEGFQVAINFMIDDGTE